MTRKWAIVIGCAVAVGCGKPSASGGTGTTETANPTLMKQRLESFIAGKSSGDKLRVTYDDLHGLHGGLTLSIDGKGKVTQKAVRTEAGAAADVKPARVKELARLLVELEAWHQLVPDEAPVPDESRAQLTIQVGSETSTIWERFNNLKKHNRMIRIRERMKDLAWHR